MDRRRGILIRVLYALCLIGATINHIRAAANNGWLPDDLPIGTAIYWSCLTLLDPLAALLLLIRPRAGIALTVVIIVTDVAHNMWFVASHTVQRSMLHAVIGNDFVMSQIAFLLFVAGTIRMAWKAAENSGSEF